MLHQHRGYDLPSPTLVTRCMVRAFLRHETTTDVVDVVLDLLNRQAIEAGHPAEVFDLNVFRSVLRSLPGLQSVLEALEQYDWAPNSPCAQLSIRQASIDLDS